MRFYLPAFLVADLTGHALSAGPVFLLTYADQDLTPRFDALAPAQREAVRAYLLVHLSDQHRGFEHASIEAALRGYWAAPEAS